MTKEEILSKVLDILEVGKPDMEDFSNRIKYQKIIYLLQTSGPSLGYGFNWYIRGPYSSPLAHVLYNINDTTYEKSKNITFNDNERIESLITDFKNKLGSDIDNVDYLEVLASLHYINKSTFSGNGEFSDLKKKLLNVKPNLMQIDNINDLVQRACDDLPDYN
ncbi:MAG TPA: hypothetical protein C5S50_11380 [Methanosarcinaceae archaeon]|nr:hypothetical protein [Methanosarcinaceae archaeon]